MAKVTMPGEIVEDLVEEVNPVDTLPEVEDDIQIDDMPVEDLLVEDMDPSEQLWPNGPTAGDIVEWKKEYGDVYITSLTFEEHLVWRTINRKEYRAAMLHMEKLLASENVSQSDALMENEEIVTEACLLFPKMTRKDFAGKKAGIPTILSQQILEASGFNPIDIRLM